MDKLDFAKFACNRFLYRFSIQNDRFYVLFDSSVRNDPNMRISIKHHGPQFINIQHI